METPALWSARHRLVPSELHYASAAGVTRAVLAADEGVSDRKWSFAPDLARGVVVTQPAVALVGGLRAAAERLCDLGPRRTGRHGLRDRQFAFVGELVELGSERLDPAKRWMR